MLIEMAAFGIQYDVDRSAIRHEVSYELVQAEREFYQQQADEEAELLEQEQMNLQYQEFLQHHHQQLFLQQEFLQQQQEFLQHHQEEEDLLEQEAEAQYNDVYEEDVYVDVDVDDNGPQPMDWTPSLE